MAKTDETKTKTVEKVESPAEPLEHPKVPETALFRVRYKDLWPHEYVAHSAGEALQMFREAVHKTDEPADQFEVARIHG